MRKVGVYVIVCARSGWAYIGSSLDVCARLDSHFRLLKEGRSHNRVLQYAYDIHGEENFAAGLHLECTPEELREKELEVMRGWTGKMFNILRDSRCIPPVSDETKRKLSARAKAQHAAGNLGRQTWKKP